MAIPVNLHTRSTTAGQGLNGSREDLLDKIFNTSPTETPVVSSIGRTTATNVLHEWQRDSLAAPNANNALIDGDDTALEAQTPTERVGNYMQIFSKRPGTSRRANLVKKAGRKNEQAYLRAKTMLELKRDMEAMVMSKNPAVAPTNTVAGKSAGLGVQNYFNTSHGVDGSTPAWTSGVPTVAPTAGTGRALTEALLKTVTQATFIASGAVPSMAVMSPAHKGVFSTFTGLAASRVNTSVGKGADSQATIVGGADVYLSDFGKIVVIPHPYTAGATDVHLLNPDYMDMAFLDGFNTEKLGKSGDSEKELVTVDCGLAVRASSAIGKIADLTGG
jgi:hypothetical protein